MKQLTITIGFFLRLKVQEIYKFTVYKVYEKFREQSAIEQVAWIFSIIMSTTLMYLGLTSGPSVYKESTPMVAQCLFNTIAYVVLILTIWIVSLLIMAGTIALISWIVDNWEEAKRMYKKYEKRKLKEEIKRAKKNEDNMGKS